MILKNMFYWHKLGLQYWAWLIKLTMISIIIITNLYRDSMICRIPSWIFIFLWGLWSLFFDFFFKQHQVYNKVKKKVPSSFLCLLPPHMHSLPYYHHHSPKYIYIYFNQGWGTLIHYSHSKTIAYLWFHSW